MAEIFSGNVAEGIQSQRGAGINTGEPQMKGGSRHANRGDCLPVRDEEETKSGGVTATLKKSFEIKETDIQMGGRKFRRRQEDNDKHLPWKESNRTRTCEKEGKSPSPSG